MMRVDIIKLVSQCISCAQTQSTTHATPIFEYPITVGPFGTVAIDLLKLPHSHKNLTDVLVCFDNFSRFVVLVPLLNKTPEVVAHALVSHITYSYTSTFVLLSDNGT